MTADVQRELAEALPESLGPISLRSPSPPLIPDSRPEPRGYGDQLIEALLPTVQALIAEEGKRAAAAALREQQLWDRKRVEDYAAVVGVELSPGDDTIAAVDELYRAALDPAGADSGEGR